jgi:hypothetical protein
VGRRANVIPTRHLHVVLPKAELDQVDALLWSEFESRVPLGGYQKFFTTLIRQQLTQTEIDLAPYIGSLPGEFIVRADPAAAAILLDILTGKRKLP